LPAAEEMISLPDQLKKQSHALHDGLHLHYFPDIPVDEPPEECRSFSPNREFQRSLFENMGADCAVEESTPDLEETPAPAKGPSVEEIRENAFQKGFAEGQRVGFESGTKKADPIIKSLCQALVQLQNIRKEIRQEIEKEVVQLALAIAKKIVCHEVRTNQETVVCVAQEALSRVENSGKIKIKLNPQDLQFIKDAKFQLSQFLHNVDHIRFEATDSIQSGGCLIETDRGDIDARLEKQLQAIEEAFQSQFGQPKQEN
jgi:flagellar biosynthesis/type III secretory pathway protein FliH